jgi:argininosuccinate lyase
MSIFRSAKLKKEMDREIAEYISSLSFDGEILNAVIWINAVHLRMLNEKGLLSIGDLQKALNILREIYENPPKELDPRIEDIHVFIEEAISSASEYSGGMLSYSKSRNDTVATAIRIRAREYLLETALTELSLVDALLNQAEIHSETIFPIYTHLQRAVPGTFGFLLHSYASRILRNTSNIVSIYARVNLSPLGSAAATGSSAPIDRLREAQLLGFEDLVENSLDATTSRDYIITISSYLASSAITYSCLAEELILYSTEEFDLIEFPDEFASTSSIMPQKKNPVVAEIARTKVGEVLGEIVKIVSIMSRQPSGYNLDYQQITPKLWNSFREVKDTAKILSKMITAINVNREKALKSCTGSILLAEVANRFVEEGRLSFRIAHQLCAELSEFINKNTLDSASFEQVIRKHNVSNIDFERFQSWLDPHKIIHSYRTIGSANPEEVKKMIEVDRRRVEGLRQWCRDTLEKLQKLFFSSIKA